MYSAGLCYTVRYGINFFLFILINESFLSFIPYYFDIELSKKSIFDK